MLSMSPVVLESKLKLLLAFRAPLESGLVPQPQQHCSGASGAGKGQSQD